jgi:hypothetical protein
VLRLAACAQSRWSPSWFAKCDDLGAKALLDGEAEILTRKAIEVTKSACFRGKHLFSDSAQDAPTKINQVHGCLILEPGRMAAAAHL